MIKAPVAHGSGGGHAYKYMHNSQLLLAKGGAGGGAVKIMLTGDLTMSSTNTRISANGERGTQSSGATGGGGAGGSVYVVANALVGTAGVISASGEGGKGSSYISG